MSRATISAAEVRVAFEKLLSQAIEPNAQSIHDLLQKGSVAVIQKHLTTLVQASKHDLLSDLPASETPAPQNSSPREEPAPVVAAPAAAQGVTVEIKPALSAEPRPAAPNNNGQKRPQFQVKKPQQQNQQRREGQPNHHNHQQNHANHHQQPHQNEPAYDYEPAPEAPLESLSSEALIIKIKRLESSLLKEQARRETAEKIALETKDNADTIREQVAHRINDLRQNMDLVIEQLKTQLREQKQNYAQDLKQYQDQINLANHALLS